MLRFYLLKKISETKESFLECDSAFNGFGIYKLKSFKNCKYQSLMDKQYYSKKKLDYIIKTFNLNINKKIKPYDCEHRIFHLKAKKLNNAKVVIFKQYLFPGYVGPHTSFIKM